MYFVLFAFYSAPSASQQFEGRGADDLNNELTQIMTRILSNTSATSSSASSAAGINLSKLCIIPGQQCWILYVDALVLDYGGNLMDAIFMGTRAAIFDTRIPKTEVQDLGDGQFEFEVLDDAEDTDIVDGREDMPICVTLNKVWDGKALLLYVMKLGMRAKPILTTFYSGVSFLDRSSSYRGCFTVGRVVHRGQARYRCQPFGRALWIAKRTGRWYRTKSASRDDPGMYRHHVFMFLWDPFHRFADSDTNVTLASDSSSERR